jgi:hypothetical protein
MGTKEEFKPEKIFMKDGDNLEMLRQSLKSKEIDKDIIPILEKFIILPITPRESCYGHAKEIKSPYLSYIEDDVQNESDKKFQKLFREKIAELATRINYRIGSEAIRIDLEEADHGRGPKDYTLRFQIIDNEVPEESVKKIIHIAWDEFSKYIDELRATR